MRKSIAISSALVETKAAFGNAKKLFTLPLPWSSGKRIASDFGIPTRLFILKFTFQWMLLCNQNYYSASGWGRVATLKRFISILNRFDLSSPPISPREKGTKEETGKVLPGHVQLDSSSSSITTLEPQRTVPSSLNGFIAKQPWRLFWRPFWHFSFLFASFSVDATRNKSEKRVMETSDCYDLKLLRLLTVRFRFQGWIRLLWWMTENNSGTSWALISSLHA